MQHPQHTTAATIPSTSSTSRVMRMGSTARPSSGTAGSASSARLDSFDDTFRSASAPGISGRLGTGRSFHWHPSPSCRSAWRIILRTSGVSSVRAMASPTGPGSTPLASRSAPEPGHSRPRHLTVRTTPPISTEVRTRSRQPDPLPSSASCSAMRTSLATVSSSASRSSTAPPPGEATSSAERTTARTGAGSVKLTHPPAVRFRP
mmetsp:Transcript_16371/g.41914  ORF Transcript_16371/g.41914 Transcript_16371/m.41914 type:complete len:205 (-) Transcript_16371:182-796(-)